MRTEKEQKDAITKLIMYSMIFVVVLFLVLGGFYTIKAGYRGVLLTFGKPNMDVKEEGLHFKIPLVQSIKKLEVRTQKIEVQADSASKDLQDVQTKIALNFHLSPGEVPSLYQEIGKAYRERIIDPAIEESVKSVTAKFTAEELITRRSEVRLGFKNNWMIRLKKYYIKVDDFNIVNFQFSEEFDKAIESKVTAVQLKLKAERDLERIKIEKEQAIARAEAEAKSLELQKQQVTPDLIKLREIEARIKAIEVWDGKLPLITGGAIPFISMEELQPEETNE